MKHILLILAFLSSVSLADDDMPKSKIILPIHPVLIEPDKPKPVVDPTDPTVISEIKPDEMWVIESPIELFVLTSPVNVLDVETTEGPIRVRGKFSDGLGKIEVRNYSSKWVYFVTTKSSSGKAEVIMIPAGVKSESDIVRQVLTISGTGPKPPPEPDPEPEPTPEPTAKHIRLAIVEDTLNRSPDTAILMNQLVGWNEFLDAGNEWRQYDKATTEPKGVQAKTDAGSTPLPAMVFYDRDTGKLLVAAPLVKTFAELKATIGGLTNDQ